MNPGEELVQEPFERLIEEQRLLAYPYDGFWRAMDTFKDKMLLDEDAARATRPGRSGPGESGTAARGSAHDAWRGDAQAADEAPVPDLPQHHRRRRPRDAAHDREDIP